MLSNPLIIKELIQAAHSRRNYLVRTALPLAAMLLITPQILATLSLWGQDWRAVARVARSIFETCAWIQLIGFSIAALTYGSNAIQREWVQKTMELLCATPLSRFKIIYGKLFAVLGKILLLGLSLLPLMGIWFHMGRIPREVALGSMAVVLGSVVFFGAAALTQACACRTSKGNTNAFLLTIVPWFLIIVLLDMYVYVKHPFLEAAIPPRALYLVLAGTAPVGCSVGGFALLSMGIHFALAALALAMAPRLFERSFRKEIGDVRRSAGPLQALRRLARAKRPPMGETESPFAWQEKGAPTRLLPWAIWIVYAIIMVFVLGFAFTENEFDFLTDDEFYISMFAVGMIVLPVISLFYGSTVFAREKTHRRAKALLLTGRSPHTFLRAKIVAVYRALWTSVTFLSLFGAALAAHFALLSRSRWSRSPFIEWPIALLALGCPIALCIYLIVKRFRRSKARRDDAVSGDRRNPRRQRVRAFLRACWFPLMLVLGLASILMLGVIGHYETHDGEVIFAIIAAQCVLFGPAVGVIIGMVFSMTARSPSRAGMGIASAFIWSILFAFAGGIFMMITGSNDPQPSLLLVTMFIGLLLAVVWRWTPVLLGALLGAQFWFMVTVLASMDEAFSGYMEETSMLFASILVTAGITFLWYIMGARMFDRAMAGEAPRLWFRFKG